MAKKPVAVAPVTAAGEDLVVVETSKVNMDKVLRTLGFLEFAI